MRILSAAEAVGLDLRRLLVVQGHAELPYPEGTACAEVLRLRGDTAAASAWVSTVRERFPRHRSFQAEMESALRRR